jgi:hypothetical protein
MTAVEPEAISGWLRALYGGATGWISAVTFVNGRPKTQFFPASAVDAATRHIAARATRYDVYTGCCPLSGPLPDSRRGGEDDTAAMIGVWADLDVAGPGHKPKALPLPSDRTQVLEVLHKLGLPPTALVDSGGGLQAWWLFHEPWTFNTDDDRRAAAKLSTAFGETVVELYRRHGLHADNVGDLARVLRPIGTINHKYGVPVRLAHRDPSARFDPGDVVPVLLEPARPARPSTPSPPSRPGRGESPAEAFARVVSWATILEPAGFMWIYEHGGADHWHHPASTTGARSVSATTGAHGTPVLVVFSESAAAALGLPSGPHHRLTKFRTWALLNFGGDESAAARALVVESRRVIS